MSLVFFHTYRTYTVKQIREGRRRSRRRSRRRMDGEMGEPWFDLASRGLHPPPASHEHPFRSDDLAHVCQEEVYVRCR